MPQESTRHQCAVASPVKAPVSSAAVTHKLSHLQAPDLQRHVRGFSPSLGHDVRQICGLFVKGYGHCWAAKVEPRVSRIGALLQGLGCAPGTSRFLPGFGADQESTAGRRDGRRSQSTRNRMPVMRGLLAPQNTFLDTIATRFDGTRKCADRTNLPFLHPTVKCKYKVFWANLTVPRSYLQ